MANTSESDILRVAAAPGLQIDFEGCEVGYLPIDDASVFTTTCQIDTLTWSTTGFDCERKYLVAT